MLAGPAAAAETVTTIAGAPGPGPSKYDKVFVTKFGPQSAKRVLLLMPGYYGGAGDFTLDAREIVKRVPGPSGLGLRPSLAGARGHVALRGRPGRAHHRPAGLRLLPRLADEPVDPTALPAPRPGEVRLRQAMGALARPAGRAPCGAQRQAPGQARDPRRSFPRRLDDRRLRELGLRRPSRLPRTSTASCSSTAACWARSRPPTSPPRRRRSRLSTPTAPSWTCWGSTCRGPPASSPRAGAVAALKEPTALVDRAVLPAAPGCVQAADPGHQPRAAGLRPRRLHLAQGARPHPCARGHARTQRRLGRRRGHADRAPRADLRPGARQRDRVVLPGQALDRRRRRQRA